MDFKSALRKVYKSSRNKEQLNNPFIVYSRVSDLIGNSYNDKKKVELFFEITKEVNLFSLAAKYGEDGKNEIICMYNEVKELVSKESFSELVDLVYDIVFRGTKPELSIQCIEPETQVEEIKPKQPQKLPTQEKRKEPKAKKKLTSKKTSSAKPSTKGRTISICVVIGIIIAAILGLVFFGKYIPLSVWQWMVGIACGVVLILIEGAVIRSASNKGRSVSVCITIDIIIAIVLCIIIFGKYIPWDFWQWVIGIGGGILLIVIVGALLIFLSEEFDVAYYASGTIFLYLLSIANFVVLCVFCDLYQIIFICYSVIFLLSGIALAVGAFEDFEENWGIATIIALVLTTIFMILGLILI